MKARVDDLIRRQCGVISRRQALALGLSPGAIKRLIAGGEWWPVHSGVYLSRSHPQSPEAEVWAAVLAVPDPTVAGVSAPWWWGFTDQVPTRVDLLVPESRRPRAKRGIVIVRRDLDPLDRALFRGVPVLAKPLAALDGAVAMGRRGPAMLDRALQRSVGFADVRDAHYRNLGRHGSARAGELLQAAGDRAAAESERLLITLLRQAGIGGFTVNQKMVGSDGQTDVPDFTFARQRVLVYVDGWAWHHDPDRFRRDRRRQNALALQGWTVLRFTWFDLVNRPAQVVAEIRRALGLG